MVVNVDVVSGEWMTNGSSREDERPLRGDVMMAVDSSTCVARILLFQAVLALGLRFLTLSLI